jgi:hypothetical protein
VKGEDNEHQSHNSYLIGLSEKNTAVVEHSLDSEKNTAVVEHSLDSVL